jgi:hypothetical protein
VVSTTVTVVVAVALLHWASQVLNVTVVEPGGKMDGASLVTKSGPGQLSVAVGSGTVTAVPRGPDCSTVIGAGTPANTGGVVSRTVTTTLSDATPPRPSFTVRTIVWTPAAMGRPAWDL